MQTTTTSQTTSGDTTAMPARTADFAEHPGFSRMFMPDRLTLGLFLPLWPYAGDMTALRGQGEIIERVDRTAFASLWVRDVPLADPSFGDVGQVFDPWTSLAWLAARTRNVALAAGSAVLSLRHPIDVAKQSASIDHLSGGRLVLGTASGDRASEFPAYGIERASRGDRFRDAVEWLRALTETSRPTIESGLGSFTGGVDLIPKPVTGRMPLLVTGSSGQAPEWIAQHADGWLTYPGETHTPSGPEALGTKIAAWRDLIPDGRFKPVVTNEWIDLTEKPNTRPTPLRSGFVLRTGTEGLIDLLGQWQDAGVNHGALGVQHGSRPAAETVQQLIEDVVPHFPAIAGPDPRPAAW